MPDFHSLTITGCSTQPNDALWVTFEVPPELAQRFGFVPGQYLTFRTELDGQEVRRSYSICAGLGQTLSVLIKKIEDGVFSCHAHDVFEPGMQVEVAPPEGEFIWQPGRQDCVKSYLCIAAGSGITPVISIVESVLAGEANSRVTLLYGNRGSGSIIFRDRLTWLKNAYMGRLQWINIFSREKQNAAILNGRINNRKGAELNQRLIDIAGFDEFYLCGPEAMVSEVTRGLRQQEISENRIHYELFFASAEDAREAKAKHHARVQQYAGQVTQVAVRSAGREISFELSADGENILDGAMSHGIDLPYSCKGGVCATCKARLLEGEVDMDLNHSLSPEELDAGYILTCQAHPISAKVVVDYDVG